MGYIFAGSIIMTVVGFSILSYQFGFNRGQKAL